MKALIKVTYSDNDHSEYLEELSNLSFEVSRVEPPTEACPETLIRIIKKSGLDCIAVDFLDNNNNPPKLSFMYALDKGLGAMEVIYSEEEPLDKFTLALLEVAQCYEKYSFEEYLQGVFQININRQDNTVYIGPVERF